jgi:uncharacterized membrane protein
MRGEAPEHTGVPPEARQPPVGSGPEAPPPRLVEPAGSAPRTGVAVRDDERSPTAQAETPPRPADDGSRRFVFDCGNGVIFGVRTVAGQATLSSAQALGAEAVTLPRVDAESGARYADGESSYWNRGGLATFEIRERTFADCTSSPGAAQTAEARRRAPTFRARGHEPEWLIEVSRDRIELATELGTRRVELPYREPTVAGTRTTYRSFLGTQELVLIIDAARCNDTMSGEPFEYAATVTFGNDTLYGCGQTP